MTEMDRDDVKRMIASGATMPEVMRAFPWLTPEEVAPVIVDMLRLSGRQQP